MRITLSNSFLITTLVSLVTFDCYQNSTFASKTIVFTILSVGFIFYFIWQIILSKKNLFVSSIDLVVFALLVHIISNALIKGTINSLRYYDLISCYAYYLFLRNVIRAEKTILAIVLGVSLAIFVNTLYGWGQYFYVFESFHSNYALTGSFFNPAPFAGLIAVGSMFSVFLILYRKSLYRYITNIKARKTIVKFLYYLTVLNILLSIGVLIILQSRASWLAFIIGTSYMVYTKVTQKIKFSIKRYGYIATAFVLIAVCTFFFYTMRKDSADGRVLVWKISTEMLKDFSLTGTGLDGYKAHYMDYQAQYFAENKASKQEIALSDNVVYAFNDFLQFFIEEGILGFLLLVTLIWFIFKQPKSIVRNISTCLILVLLAFACFSYPLQILPLKLIAFTAIAFIAFPAKNKQEFKLPYAFMRWQILSITIAWIGLQLYNAYSLHTGYSIWKKAFDAYQEMNFKESISLYKNSYKYLKTNGEFLMHYGKALSLAEQPQCSNLVLHQAEQYLNNTVVQTSLGDNYTALEGYPQAIQHYQKACDMIPNRLYPHYLLAKMYEKQENFTKAKQEATIILQMPVKIPSIATYQIREEMKELLKMNDKPDTK